jgi:hypothetical protein
MLSHLGVGGDRLGRGHSPADHSGLHRLELSVGDDTAAPQVGQPGKVVDRPRPARGRGGADTTGPGNGPTLSG